MQIKVLGAAAGGGFPQWNCYCENCTGVRDGSISAQKRTQSSIAISSNGSDWILFNASPDIRQQMLNSEIFRPRDGLRGTTIRGIVLMDAQLDHTSGLLFLREGNKLPVYCTDSVHRDLSESNPIFKILGHYCGVTHHPIAIDAPEPFSVEGVEDLHLTAIPLKSKAPPYSPNRERPQAGDNIAIHVYEPKTGKSLFYAPGLGIYESHLEAYFEKSDCLLVDGTFWHEDEMIRQGLGKKRASEMGHLHLEGEHGMLEILKGFPKSRRILIHINNSNPILNEQSFERRQLDKLNIEVAYDGMDIHI